MHAFLPVPGGFASRIEDVERTILARLFRDTAELLGTRLGDGGSGPVSHLTHDAPTRPTLSPYPPGPPSHPPRSAPPAGCCGR